MRSTKLLVTTYVSFHEVCEILMDVPLVKIVLVVASTSVHEVCSSMVPILLVIA